MGGKKRSMWTVIKLCSAIVASCATILGSVAIYMEKIESNKNQSKKEAERAQYEKNESKKLDLVLKKMTSLGLTTIEAKTFLMNFFGENYIEILENDQSRNNLLKLINEKSLKEILSEKEDFKNTILELGFLELDDVTKEKIKVLTKESQLKELVDFIDSYLLQNIYLNSNSRSELSYSKGMAYYQLMQYDKAMEHIEKALLYNKNIKNYYLFLSQIQIIKGLHQSAIQTILKGLKIWENDNQQDAIYFSRFQKGLSICYRILGDTEKATDHLSAAVANLDVSIQEREELASMTFELSSIYIFQGRNDEALVLNKKIIGYLNDVSENRYMLGVTELLNGMAYKNIFRFKEAYSAVKRAQNHFNIEYGTNHPLQAKIHFALGQLFLAKGEFGKSIKNLEIAKEIQLKYFGKNYIGLATVYNDLGLAYLGLEELKNAQIFLEKALAKNIKNFSQNNPDIANSYSNLATLYLKLKKEEIALDHLDKAILIYSSIQKPNPHLYGNVLYKKGMIYFKNTKFEKAEKSLVEAEKQWSKSERAKSLKNNSNGYSVLNYDLGLCFAFLKKYDLAKLHLNKALVMLKDKYPEGYEGIDDIETHLKGLNKMN